MQETKSSHILVTDLNHYLCDILVRELENEEYLVSCIRNGIEICSAIRNDLFLDVVMLDRNRRWSVDRQRQGECRQERGQKSEGLAHPPIIPLPEIAS